MVRVNIVGLECKLAILFFVFSLYVFLYHSNVKKVQILFHLENTKLFSIVKIFCILFRYMFLIFLESMSQSLLRHLAIG